MCAQINKQTYIKFSGLWLELQLSFKLHFQTVVNSKMSIKCAVDFVLLFVFFSSHKCTFCWVTGLYSTQKKKTPGADTIPVFATLHLLCKFIQIYCLFYNFYSVFLIQLLENLSCNLNLCNAQSLSDNNLASLCHKSDKK